MKKLLFVFFLISFIVTLLIYDGRKFFTGSWMLRIYVAAREDALNDLAEKLYADSRTTEFNYYHNGSFLFKLEKNDQYDQLNNQLSKEYLTLYKKTLFFGFSPCQIWKKKDNYISCFGVGFPGSSSSKNQSSVNQNYALIYSSEQVFTNPGCSANMKKKSIGSCEIKISDSWTLHYSWIPL